MCRHVLELGPPKFSRLSASLAKKMHIAGMRATRSVGRITPHVPLSSRGKFLPGRRVVRATRPISLRSGFKSRQVSLSEKSSYFVRMGSWSQAARWGRWEQITAFETSSPYDLPLRVVASAHCHSFVQVSAAAGVARVLSVRNSSASFCFCSNSSPVR